MRRHPYFVVAALALGLAVCIGQSLAEVKTQPASLQVAPSDNPLELAKSYTGKMIKFDMDICAFKLYDSPSARIEVYYDIPNDQLQFAQLVSGEYATTLIIAVRILDKDGKIVKEAASRGSTRVKDKKETTDPSLSGKFVCAFNLKPGDYVFKVGVKDNLSNKIGVLQKEFKVKTIEKDQLAISSVEFGGDVVQAKPGEQSGFFKPSLNVVVPPNPSRKYHLGDTLSVYFNIYNLQVDNAGRPRFHVTYKFKRAGDRRIQRVIAKGQRIKGKNQSHLYSLPLDPKRFQPGNYTLFITVTDEISKKAVETKEPFFII